MYLISSQFQNNEPLPTRYTCDGLNISPPLGFSGVPMGSKSIVLMLEDPDSSHGKNFNHWLVYNISASTRIIFEGDIPDDSMVGVNDFGTQKYEGPCPQDEDHRFVFKAFALDTKLDLGEGATKEQVQKEMLGHIINSDDLTGIYTHENQDTPIPVSKQPTQIYPPIYISS